MPEPATRVPSPSFYVATDDPTEPSAAVYSSEQVWTELRTGRPFSRFHPNGTRERVEGWQGALVAMGFRWGAYGAGIASLRTRAEHSLRRLVRDLVELHSDAHPNEWIAQRALMHATFLHLLAPTPESGAHVHARVEDPRGASDRKTIWLPRPDGEVVVFDLEGPEWYVDLCGALQVRDLGLWATGEAEKIRRQQARDHDERLQRMEEERRRFEAEQAVNDLGRLGDNLDELGRA